MLTLALAAAWGTAPAVAQDVVYSEIQPAVGVSVELGGAGGFAEAVTYSLYFLSDSSSLQAGVTLPNNEIRDASVLNIVPAGTTTATADTTVAAVEQCQLVDAVLLCDPLDRPAMVRIRDDGEGHGVFLAITIPDQSIDWEGGSLRLKMAAGSYRLSVVAADSSLQDERDSPVIVDATLPTLADLEQQYLEQRPFLHLAASPLIRGQKTGDSGFDDLGLSFSGGIYRVRGGGDTRFELSWAGEVATNDSATFNHLTVDAGLARNLWPGDWLPLTLSMKGESDQGFDAFDLSANASLSVVLPFNLNLQSGSYRPALAPRVTMLAAWGSALHRDSTALEETFSRAGYEVKWRVPVGEENMVRFHHTNVWNHPAGEGGSWHTLWDIQVDLPMGGMTYHVGYQKGEAAPLFQPIETTRVGLSFSIGDPTGSSP